MYHTRTQTIFRKETISGVQFLLNKYCELFSDKPPKGFGKFFGERSSSPPKASGSNESKQSESEPKLNRPRKSDNPFEFKTSFGGGGGGGGHGSDGKKPGGKDNADREKLFTIGMIGSALLIGTMSYYSYSYQEIGWKDLTT